MSTSRGEEFVGALISAGGVEHYRLDRHGPHRLYMSNLHIPEEERGHGRGSTLMQQVTEQADQEGSEVVLHARADLHPWYGRFGFERYPEGDFFDKQALIRRPTP